MAGIIAIDTLENGSGASVPTTTVINGSAKAWVNFNGTNGVIKGAFNVSSVTRNSAGQYTVNFSSAMPNTNYSAVVVSSFAGIGLQTASNIFSNAAAGYVAPTTTYFYCAVTNLPGNQYVDPISVNATVFA